MIVGNFSSLALFGFQETKATFFIFDMTSPLSELFVHPKVRVKLSGRRLWSFLWLIPGVLQP